METRTRRKTGAGRTALRGAGNANHRDVAGEAGEAVTADPNAAGVSTTTNEGRAVRQGGAALVLPRAFVELVARLRSKVFKHGNFKGYREIMAKADALVPEAGEFGKWQIWQTTNWGDGSAPSISVPVTITGCETGYELARTNLLMLRAQREEVPEGTIKVTFRLRRDVVHIASQAHAWIDCETGEVIKSKVWRKHVDGEEVAA
jgi:hypothetical protein